MALFNSSPVPDATSDSALVARVLAGEVAAYEPLVQRYQAYIWTLVARQVPGGPVAELTQEILVSAYQALGQWQGASLKAWLAGIAFRRCQDYWRRQARQPSTPMSVPGGDDSEILDRAMSSAAEEQFNRDTERREWREILDWALVQLRPEDRQVVTLLYLEGHAVRLVAQWLGWTVTKTKVRGFRARQQLRRLLAEHAPAQSHLIKLKHATLETPHETDSA